MPSDDPQDEPIDGEILDNTTPTVAKHPAPYSKRDKDTLTDKQSAFVDAIIAGKMPSEAYKLAYDTSKMNPATIAQRAYDLCHKHSNVKAIIAAHKANKAAKSLINRSIIEERLWLNAERAAGNQTQKLKMLRNGEVQEVEAHFVDRSAANTAYVALGKEHGMFIDRREVGTPGEFARLDEAELASMLLQTLQSLDPND